MQQIQLEREFHLDDNVITTVVSDFRDMLNHWKEGNRIHRGTRSYLNHIEAKGESLHLSPYGQITPHLFPVVMYSIKEGTLYDYIGDDLWETPVVTVSPTYVPNKLFDNPDMVNHLARLEIDIPNNRFFHYQINPQPEKSKETMQDVGNEFAESADPDAPPDKSMKDMMATIGDALAGSLDDNPYLSSPLRCSIIPGVGYTKVRMHNGQPYITNERDEYAPIDTWRNLDREGNYALWVIPELSNLRETTFLFREIPLSMALEKEGYSPENVRMILVPENMKHLDDLNIEHANTIDDFFR